MPVVKCPECGERVEVGPGMEGRRVVCPECDERFTVPARRRREDDEDAPRPRKKRRKEAGPNWGVIGGFHVKSQKYDYDLTAQGGGYSLDYMILPAGAAPRPEQEAVFLRLPRHQVERLGKGQMTAERSTTLAGAPATEIVFTVPGN